MQAELSSYNEWSSFVAAFSTAECEAIVRLCRSFSASAPTIVGQEMAPGRRLGTIHRIPAHPKTEWLYAKLLELAALANQRHFGLALTGIMKPPEYVEYYEGRGRFDWHNDYGLERPISLRKLTVSVQLSPASDYDGGDLQIFDTEQTILPRDQGSVTILPSIFYHRVKPVTRGTRRALVAWIAGPSLV